MTAPGGRLPSCAPGDSVAVLGEGLLDEIRDRYTAFGADVGPLGESRAVGADLILLDRPTARDLSSAEAALRPGGAIVIRGMPSADASLAGPDAVLSELRIEFVRDDAN